MSSPSVTAIRVQYTRLLIEGDETGALVFVDDRLAVVLSQLASDAHPVEQRGLWHVEALFGSWLESRSRSTFDTLEACVTWLESLL